MSTPSPVPLDNFDPVSPYAPKWARGQTSDMQAESEPAAEAAEPKHPPGIETDHDARILDEIEASLRAMIAANHGGEDPARLSDIARLAAEQVAQEQEQEQDQPIDEAAQDLAPTPHPLEPHARPSQEQLASDIETVRAAVRDPRTPPWLLQHSLEPQSVPEPLPEPVSEGWPPRRKRHRSNRLFLQFGLAATGAAVVAAVAIKDIPTLFMDYVREPLADLSDKAAAVFNEGKATPLQARMEQVEKRQDRAAAPAPRYTVASADTRAQAIPVKTETIAPASEPRETVMTPWPAPEQPRRPEPSGWQMPQPKIAAPAPAVAAVPAPAPVVPSAPAAAPKPAPANDAPAASRTLSAEEIAVLRKMGDDYISAGDFVGARAVLERAADAGDASAAFAIASTYDPVVLERFKVRGLDPDIVKAEFWYERARALGSSEAPHRLQAMMASRGN